MHIPFNHSRGRAERSAGAHPKCLCRTRQIWSRRRVSNPRHSRWQRNPLPTEVRLQFVMRSPSQCPAASHGKLLKNRSSTDVGTVAGREHVLLWDKLLMAARPRAGGSCEPVDAPRCVDRKNCEQKCREARSHLGNRASRLRDLRVVAYAPSSPGPAASHS